MKDYISRLKGGISWGALKPFFALSESGPSTSFQFMSDLHLEVGQQYNTFNFPATAPYLILAGDIGRLIDYDAYLQFLSRQTARYERVFLVLGNHEFYGMDFATGVSTARRLESEDLLRGKLCLLHQTRQDLAGGKITVLGCPLWSRIPEEAVEAVRSRVKDFQNIGDWTVERHNEAHETDLQWLKAELGSHSEEESGKAVVVVTHHAPSIQETSRPDQVDSLVTCAFATDLLPTGGWGPVAYWVYGHTHYSNDFEKGRTKVVSNQRGYVLPGTDLPVGSKRDASRQKFETRKVIRIALGRERAR